MSDITMEEYQKGALSTAIYPGKGTLMGLIYTALGLGEAGELQGKVKKILRDANDILTDEVHTAIVSELGDILWYLAAMSDELGVPLSDVARYNLMKLADRKARGKLQGDGDIR